MLLTRICRREMLGNFLELFGILKIFWKFFCLLFSVKSSGFFLFLSMTGSSVSDHTDTLTTFEVTKTTSI